MDWAAEGLLDGCADEAAREARRALLDKLHADGVPVEELRRAVAEERLALLPVDRLLTSEAHYTAREIAEESGLDLDFFQDQRRVLGPGRCRGPTSASTASATSRPRGWATSTARPGCPTRTRWRPSACSAAAWPATSRRSRHWSANRCSRAASTSTSSPLARGGLDDAACRSPARGSSTSSRCTCARRCGRRSITSEQLTSGRLDSGRDCAVAFADLVGFTELGETIPVEELGSVAGRLSRLAEAGDRAAGEDRQGDRRRGDARSRRARAAGGGGPAARRGARPGDDGLPAIRAGRRLRPRRQPLGRLVRLNGQRRQPPDEPRAPRCPCWPPRR